ncbi:MAG: haloacid dehalogenase type II [Pseudomonadota bacterium]
MKTVVAFDIYGTLIDTHGVVSLLQKIVGDQARLFSQTWRDKQLEYSFRKGLMKCYQPFSVCTAEALEYTCRIMQTSLSQDEKHRLLNQYSALPCFDDVVDGLQSLRDTHTLVAFSNGEISAVNGLLERAGIGNFFVQVVSADEIKTFKPDPKIYHYLLERTNSTPENTWLISSNPFDVIGARAVSINTAWVKRNNAMVFDPWELKPSVIVDSLSKLSSTIK